MKEIHKKSINNNQSDGSMSTVARRTATKVEFNLSNMTQDSHMQLS